MTGHRGSRRGRGLAALLLSAAVACAPNLPALSGIGAAVSGAVVTVAALAPAPAEARSSSSGGYSRPGGGGATRTPSFGGGGSSGGYARPGGGSSGGGLFDGWSSGSGSDRDASRGQSRSALDDFLAPPRTPSTRDSGGTTTRRPSTTGTGTTRNRDYDYGYDGYGSRDYRTPSTVGRSRYGVFDAVMLWYLLDTLNDRGHADFFRDNRDDAGYRAWRADAERAAARDPEMRGKLAALDRELAAGRGDPANAGRIPADLARDQGTPGGGSLGLVIALLILGIVVFMAWNAMRKRSSRGAPPPRTVGGDGSALGTATAILRNKMSGAVYRPDLFRVGMPMVLDPTAFVLAEGATKVTAPKALSDNGTIGVDAVGTLTDTAGTYHRLYLEDEASFFQIVVDGEGNPAECRYFKRIDEVQPADREEWAFWLDKQEGMIGWPEFETKDGQRYDRVWSPGKSHIQPRQFTERIEQLRGESERHQAAMLYGRRTGAKAPAPEIEYLLVTAVQTKTQAFVELHAGIDFNPAALTLS
ncbi:YjfK family protein [Zavarzinia compransoris]|uniref:DUF2491 family protein n=1 Tax=Zavarzinia marina TaxID=2911065 RepID=UPI001F29F566|nr:DUF2491 family protein [Zavarzinia marina]MCF4167177.1 YjfK family protein [Zavarzinia marina]